MKSAIVDTNLLLRHFLQDVRSQSELATSYIQQCEGGKLELELSLLVVNEFIWISKNYYQHPKEIYVSELLKITSLGGVKVIEIKKEILVKILEKLRAQNIDFTDIYLFCIKGKRPVLTFDKDFKKIR